MKFSGIAVVLSTCSTLVAAIQTLTETSTSSSSVDSSTSSSSVCVPSTTITIQATIYGTVAPTDTAYLNVIALTGQHELAFSTRVPYEGQYGSNCDVDDFYLPSTTIELGYPATFYYAGIVGTSTEDFASQFYNPTYCIGNTQTMTGSYTSETPTSSTSSSIASSTSSSDAAIITPTETIVILSPSDIIIPITVITSVD